MEKFSYLHPLTYWFFLKLKLIKITVFLLKYTLILPCLRGRIAFHLATWSGEGHFLETEPQIINVPGYVEISKLNRFTLQVLLHFLCNSIAVQCRKKDKKKICRLSKKIKWLGNNGFSSFIEMVETMNKLPKKKSNMQLCGSFKTRLSEPKTEKWGISLA